MSTNGPTMPEEKTGDGEAQETPYWSSALSSIGIWNNSKQGGSSTGKETAAGENATKSKASIDHVTTHFHGPSVRSYPNDCPHPKVQWFHAIDVPKRSTLPPVDTNGGSEAKVQAKAKKFSAFSAQDSKRIEAQYQSLVEEQEDRRSSKETEAPGAPKSTQQRRAPGAPKSTQQKSARLETKDTRVPVNEDFLFDVSIETRELCPVYWLGPVYEVRRGTWFFQDGSNLRPCEEILAAQLEEGYIKMKAWIEPGQSVTDHVEATQTKKIRAEKETDTKQDASTKSSVAANSSILESDTNPGKLKSHRLLGTYMNNTVTYEDANTAWLVSDGVLSWVATSVYERFGGGGHTSGVKLIRGYSDRSKSKEKSVHDKQKAATDDAGSKATRGIQRPAKDDGSVRSHSNAMAAAESGWTGKALLQRRLSTIMDSEDRRTATSEDDVRKLNEEEMRHGYLTQSGDSQNREIEHLVLVTHGIGQRLSLRTQSVNFIHDVNILRKTLKAVYASSSDLRSMHGDGGDGPGNCRVQVLPVCWRHKVEFPRGRRKKSKSDEVDLAEAHDEQEQYPTLEDITIDGVAFARSLISDLALDVLLYQSSYRDEIAHTVVEESNRIVDLFRRRNPGFKGKIHVVGHSLGSAILFDILCHENRQRRHELVPNRLRFLPSRGPARIESKDTFDFDVEDFYCLGSPIGLFQMLTGRTIAARQTPHGVSSVGLATTMDSDCLDGYVTDAKPGDGVSCPDVKQLFNIFYPSDPISYRLEPLIAPSMASLKPHSLPYTKKGLFGVVGNQGLTGIGAKVGQSVSGLFASLSTGLSSNLIPASLRITSEEAQMMMQEGQSTQTAPKKEEEPKAGESHVSKDEEGFVDQSSRSATLYSRFQMKDERNVELPKHLEADGSDQKSRKQRMAQRRVWALNRNGRVDFSIQEGALDFNPISTIASHIGYWGEEDVSHFMLSQVLSVAESKSGKYGNKP